MRNAFRIKFLLDSGLSNNEDLALTLGQLQDTGDVDRGRVAGTKDIILLAWDAKPCEFLEILITGFCGVVGDEDDPLSYIDVSPLFRS